MKLATITGVAAYSIIVEKGIESLVLCSDLKVESFSAEKIELIVDRNGQNNTNLTQSAMSLKRFILLNSYGNSAVTAYITGVGAEYETVVKTDLTENGVIHLDGNDKLKINFTGLDSTKTYVVYGLESPNTSDAPYRYEEKNILASTTAMTLNTSMFDMMCLEDDASITSIDFHYANGRTCTFDRDELRFIAQDIDATAVVHKDGKVASGWVGLIQAPLIHVEEITIRKTTASDVDISFRVDETDDENYG